MVSIVIPHFNRAGLLAETLDSIRAQDYSHWEVIVVDDGSDADQWQRIQDQQTGNIQIIQRRDGRKGPSRCRNLGAMRARGQYLLFLDSDDLLAWWCLSSRMEQIGRDPGQDFWVFPVMLFRDRPGDLEVCWNRLGGEEDLLDFVRSNPPWHTSSPLWRRTAFLAVGGFNEKVLYGDDAHLHTEALLQSCRYRKYADAMPDVFVRRGDMLRITNHWSSAILESRRTRLTEGSRLLAEREASPVLRRTWEGQYFVEAEEYLFKLDDAGEALIRVLDIWERECRPPRVRRWMVRVYFFVGLRARRRAYLLLRLARRIMMRMLPNDYFPAEQSTGRGYFQRAPLPGHGLEALRKRLRQHPAMESAPR